MDKGGDSFKKTFFLFIITELLSMLHQFLHFWMPYFHFYTSILIIRAVDLILFIMMSRSQLSDLKT